MPNQQARRLTRVRSLFAAGVGPLDGVVLLILPKVDPPHGGQGVNIRSTALLGAVALPLGKSMPVDQVGPPGGVVADEDAIADSVPAEGLGRSDGAGEGLWGGGGSSAAGCRGGGSAVLIGWPLVRGRGRRVGGRRHRRARKQGIKMNACENGARNHELENL